MDELRSAVTPPGPAEAESGETPPPSEAALPPETLNLKGRIQELVAQVTAMTGEMRRREQQGDAAALRRKYETDLEQLKVDAPSALAVGRRVTPCVLLRRRPFPPREPFL